MLVEKIEKLWVKVLVQRGSKTSMSWAYEHVFPECASWCKSRPACSKRAMLFVSFQRNASALRVFSSREQWDRYSVMVGLSSLVLMRLVVHLFESQNSWKLLLMVQAKYYEAVRAW